MRHAIVTSGVSWLAWDEQEQLIIPAPAQDSAHFLDFQRSECEGRCSDQAVKHCWARNIILYELSVQVRKGTSQENLTSKSTFPLRLATELVPL